MKWIRRENFRTIEDVIEFNTGLTIEKLQNPLLNPVICGMSEAVRIVNACITAGMKITIVGDYDCDGDTSSTILSLGIEEKTGVRPEVRLPRRFSEGYGLSMKIIDEIDEGLVITVDNGIAAVEAVKAAKEKGLTVVIIDHHVIRDDGILPEADAIVDPHAIPGSEYNGYCGAGLAYRFIMELNPETKLQQELVALAGIGTVADVMPLLGDNRRLVQQSLKAVSTRNVTDGLSALLREIGIEDHPSEADYGFRIGPCFNAAGRLEDEGAKRVYELISTNFTSDFDAFLKGQEISKKAAELVALNKERQKLVFDTMKIVNQMLEDVEIKAPIVLYNPDFHEGIIGIIAGRLAETYRMPALVFTDSSTEGVVKGSGRSYADINLKEQLDKVSPYGVFIGYGGHAGAAGMSVKKSNLQELQHRMAENLQNVKMPEMDTILYDLEITEKDVPTMAEILRKYAPYGEGCPNIIFRINNFEAIPKGSSYFDIMGNLNTHIKLFGTYVNVMGFDMKNRYLEDGAPRCMDIIGTLSIMHFMGKQIYCVEIIDYQKKEISEIKNTEVFNKLSEMFNFN